MARQQLGNNLAWGGNNLATTWRRAAGDSWKQHDLRALLFMHYARESKA